LNFTFSVTVRPREAALRGLQAISRQIREIFAEHTTIIEPLSLDEALRR
jgi:nucleotidyltransferase/DNA polymerase involved in DNA repair